MMTIIEDLIDAETLIKLRTWLADATFEDGRATAGGNARLVKSNEQVSDDPSRRDPQLGRMQDLISNVLWKNDLFVTAAQTKEILSPIFSRYVAGMRYGTHMDNAIMSDMRIDLSLTLFLSDPASYSGGELVIDFASGTRSIKLPAGSAVLYATTALHRVEEVTCGERLAAVTWVRSLVRDPAAREILLDLKIAQRRLSDQIGKTHEIDLLAKSYTNLLRRWAED